jgi:hypothetical protein
MKRNITHLRQVSMLMRESKRPGAETIITEDLPLAFFNLDHAFDVPAFDLTACFPSLPSIRRVFEKWFWLGYAQWHLLRNWFGARQPSDRQRRQEKVRKFLYSNE